MNRLELIERVAGDLGVPKGNVEEVVKGALTTIASTLQGGEKVSIPGFATFSLAERKARTGRNPRTGEIVRIPATRALKFTPSAALKSAVAGGTTTASATSAGTKGVKKAKSEAAPAKQMTKKPGKDPAASKKPSRKGAKA